jgi:ribosome maturation factor RimP
LRTERNPLSNERPTAASHWLATVERTVAGLGYELVDVERAARGLLRVTIDRVPGDGVIGDGVIGDGVLAAPDDAPAADPAAEAAAGITLDDCERVTRQLQYVLEVEGVDYQRLEVSSPGLDRPLKREVDYRRFAGGAVELTLRLPFQGRKHWRGTLQPRDDGWRLELDDGQGQRALDFRFDEVREARLVPVVDFKGRKTNKGAGATGAARADDASPAMGAGVDGGLDR